MRGVTLTTGGVLTLTEADERPCAWQFGVSGFTALTTRSSVKVPTGHLYTRLDTADRVRRKADRQA